MYRRIKNVMNLNRIETTIEIHKIPMINKVIQTFRILADHKLNLRTKITLNSQKL